MCVIFMVNILLVTDDILINNGTFLVIDFVNLKINLI
jgi:hypothetical protein